jgi:hypothetical protein
MAEVNRSVIANILRAENFPLSATIDEIIKLINEKKKDVKKYNKLKKQLAKSEERELVFKSFMNELKLSNSIFVDLGMEIKK